MEVMEGEYETSQTSSLMCHFYGHHHDSDPQETRNLWDYCLGREKSIPFSLISLNPINDSSPRGATLKGLSTGAGLTWEVNYVQTGKHQ